MRGIDIRAWAIEASDRAANKKPKNAEDVRTELKGTWESKNYHRLAKQLAGHANAARGEPILWIIGVNERGVVQNIDYQETSTWWGQICSYFASPAPRLQDVLVQYKDKTILALLFETENAPFIVKSENSDDKRLEVPWREATGTRSANQSDLIKLLLPITNRPDFEVVKTELQIQRELHPNGMFGEYVCLFSADLYVVPKSPIFTPLALPHHKCVISLEVYDELDRKEIIELKGIVAESRMSFIRGKAVSKTIHENPSEILIEGPGGFNISNYNRLATFPDNTSKINLIIKFELTGIDMPFLIIESLSRNIRAEESLGTGFAYKFVWEANHL